MLQDNSIDRDLNIIIKERQREIEIKGHLVEDGEQDREGASHCKVDGGEEQNEIPQAQRQFPSTPIKRAAKESPGEIPK
jgi:hypothetical protein